MEKWNDQELEFLKQNYKAKGATYCSEFLKRTAYAVASKAKKIGVKNARVKYKYSKENLEQIVVESTTYTEVLNKLGIRTAGGNYKSVKNYIIKYAINVKHFLPNNSPKRFKRIATPLSEILVENSSFNRVLLKEKLYKQGLKLRKCEECGQDEMWRGKKLSLILDHRNGIWNDNRIENLRILCPNCNATLVTHCRGHKRPNK